MSRPWYQDVSRQEWKTFLTTFAAWTLDAFDFTIITFVLTDIRRSFEVNLALAGALATVTLLFRMVGGIVAGTLADRYGRKGPILFSIAWYTAFAFLSGLSTSYVMLFTFRGLFGIGMGGMWAPGCRSRSSNGRRNIAALHRASCRAATRWDSCSRRSFISWAIR